MAVVTAERIVLGTGEALERPLHDVAAGAEGIVVLHVIPADPAESCRAQDDHRRGGGQADLDPPLPRLDPTDDLKPAAPEEHEQPRGNRQADKKAANLKPLGEIKEETQHGGHAAR